MLRLSPEFKPYFYILVALGIFYLLYQFTLPRSKENYENQPATMQLEAKVNSKGSQEDGKTHLLVEIPHRITCEQDADCNVIYGDGKNKCVKGKCQCEAGAGTFCHKQPNYYKNPNEMTPAQIIKFKNHAKLEKMTIEDYKHWLGLFKYDVESLPREHLQNFQRLMQGQHIFEIPLGDPVEEFFADDAAKRDKVCMEIPNSEIDSPLNWKVHSQLNNSGKIDVKGNTERPLNYSRYYKHPKVSNDRYERVNLMTVKDWFMNNVNWLFYDVDRNLNYREPNLNRFMNIVDDQRNPKPDFTPQRLQETGGLLPTQEGSIAAASQITNMPSQLEPQPTNLRTGMSDLGGSFTPVAQA